ncbi:MAG: HAMP domain-containing protein [Rhodanobacteraceae bacterium]|nr:HAMP domain-containing protein [Rhodanobacteraceae bacterium]
MATTNARALAHMLRLKLWHRMFALTALATLAAVGSLLLVQQQAFRSGLLEYVNQIDRERAQGLLPALAGEYREAGGWKRIRRNPMRFRWLVDQALGGGRGAELPPPPQDRPPRERPPRMGPPGRDGGAGRPPLPPPGALQDEGPRRRYGGYDAPSIPVIGPPEPWPGALELPIEVDGAVVGSLHFLPLPRLESEWDLAFAQSQLRTGVVLARRTAHPLRQMAARTREIAAGNYAARIASERGDEIGELARDFDAMAATLEQNREARQRWTAEISHELRTPVAVIRAELEALEDGVRPFDRAAVRSLAGEAERLSRLVDDLYQLSLADAGALAYRFESCDLAECLRDSVAAHSAALQRAGLAVDADLPPACASPRRCWACCAVAGKFADQQRALHRFGWPRARRA